MACSRHSPKRTQNQHTQLQIPLEHHTAISTNDTVGKQILFCRVSPCTTAPPLELQPVLTDHQPEGSILPIDVTTAIKAQTQQGGAFNPTQGTHLECLARVVRKTVPLSPTGCRILCTYSAKTRRHIIAVLIQKNKHREAIKTRRQRNMSRTKLQKNN